MVDALFEMVADTGGKLRNETMFVEDLPGIGEGGCIWNSGAGADDVERISNDVREDKCFEPGGEGEVSELTTFESAEMFADAVEFVDGCAAGEEEFGCALLLFEGDRLGRKGEERGCATRDQTEDEIVFARVETELGDLAGSIDAGFVWDGVRSFETFYVFEGQGVSLFGDDDAGMDLFAVEFLDGAGHAGSCFTSTDDVEILCRFWKWL